MDESTGDGKIRTKVSVKREQQVFTRSGPEIADEVGCVNFEKYMIYIKT